MKNKTENKRSKIIFSDEYYQGYKQCEIDNKIVSDYIKSKPLNFYIKEINSIYIDYTMININFDTYESKDNHFEIDAYQFLEFFDTHFLNDLKDKLTNYIKNK